MTRTGTGKYEALLERCRGLAPIPTAVVHPCEASALAGAMQAAAGELIAPIMVGPKEKIVEVAQRGDMDLGAAQIIDVPHSHAAAKAAVAMLAAHARRRR